MESKHFLRFHEIALTRTLIPVWHLNSSHIQVHSAVVEDASIQKSKKQNLDYGIDINMAFFMFFVWFPAASWTFLLQLDTLQVLWCERSISVLRTGLGHGCTKVELTRWGVNIHIYIY